jgi:hypothetical protein
LWPPTTTERFTTGDFMAPLLLHGGHHLIAKACGISVVTLYFRPVRRVYGHLQSAEEITDARARSPPLAFCLFAGVET